MKLVRVFLFFVALLITNSKPHAQVVLRIETGISNFVLHPRSVDNVKKEWRRQSYIQAYRLGVEKNFRFENLSIFAGGIINIIGADQVFLGRWRFVYGGISLGAHYHLGKFNFGLRSTPSLQVWTNITQGFGYTPTVNIDLEPNVSWYIGKQLQLSGGFSHGINPSIELSKNITYSHISYFAGLTYVIKGKRDN